MSFHEYNNMNTNRTITNRFSNNSKVMTSRTAHESLPKIAKSSKNTFHIEDFYLSSITKELGAASKRFDKIKTQCLDSIVKQSQKSMSTAIPSTNSDPFTNNLLLQTATHSGVDCLPSYGNFIDTIPRDVKANFKNSTEMEKHLKNFDHAFYCLEEVSY